MGEVKEELEASCGKECAPNVLRAYAYDGLWTLAMAVHRLSMNYQRTYGTMWDPLSNSGNWSSTHARLLLEINNTSFNGVTVCNLHAQLVKFFLHRYSLLFLKRMSLY